MATFLIITLAMFCTAIPLWLGQRHGLVRLVSPMHLLAYFGFLGFFVKVLSYASVPELAFYARFVESPDAL